MRVASRTTGASSLGWLLGFVVVLSHFATGNSTTPTCADAPGAFAQNTAFPSGECADNLPSLADGMGTTVATVCAWMASELAALMASVGVTWTPPSGFTGNSPLADFCGTTCAAAGVYGIYCPTPPPSLPPSPSVPPAPPMPPLAPGETFVLPGNGTLQAALDAASDGDKLVLANGTYTGSNHNVLWIGKSISIRALHPRGAVINGEYARRCVYITIGNVVLEGIDISRGYSVHYDQCSGSPAGRGGAGVLVFGSTVNFNNCDIYWNTVDGQGWCDGGGGVRVIGGAANFSKCEIHSNQARDLYPNTIGGLEWSTGGGGVAIGDGTVNFNNCKIFMNQAQSYGAGIYTWTYSNTGSVTTFDSCDIHSNTAPLSGGAAYVTSAAVIFTSCSIYSNQAGDGAALTLDGIGGPVNVHIDTCTFRDNVGSSAIVAATAVTWRCLLGQYMPETGVFPVANFVGCMFNCSAGTIGDLHNLTSAGDCAPCPVGHYCGAAGLAAGTPCRSGTRMPAIGARSADACLPCGAGRFSNQTGLSENCPPCPAGSYTEADDASSCTRCPIGGYCPDAGASSRAVFQPCPSGTHNPDAGASRNTSCIGCPVGKANPVRGSFDLADCTYCLPGSVASSTGTAICRLCESGKFQREYGQTACESCVPGFYCKEGAAEPVPCPAGYYGNATGFYSPGQCTPAPIGFWAPLGSALPKLCPPSGFYCPGTLRDTVNDVPGSEPIIMPVGASTETEKVSALEQMMTLDLSIDDFAAQRERLTVTFAARYGVHPSLVTLEASAGSVQLTVTIAATNGTGEAINLDALEQVVSAVDDAALATLIGQVVGQAVNVTSRPVEHSTVKIEVAFSCPKGSWCTAGRVVPCSQGTYNPLSDMSDATTCVRCPPNSDTDGEGASSRANCTCTADFYDANASFAIDTDLVAAMRRAALEPINMTAAVVDCQPCVVGTNCSRSGATLEELPLRVGYFRLTKSSVDVQRCPDAAEGCAETGVAVCNESNSGCRGGTVPNDASCAANLTGPFCMACEDDSAIYRQASSSDVATCVDCNDSQVLGKAALAAFLVVAIAFVALIVIKALRRCLQERTQAWLARLWRAAKPANKLKICIGFYMIATKIEQVYQVVMPASVRRMLSYFSLGVSFGLGGTDDVLMCLGIRGFVYRLVFWMVLPAGLLILIVAGSALRLVCKRDLSSRALVATALPLVTYALFLLYPLVANAAFEAFSCHGFDDRTKEFLVADVEVPCSIPRLNVWSPQHESIKALAWVAIAIYPLGLVVVYGAVLFAARKAIRTGQSTLLSHATRFLHREYEPDFFWWELMEMARRVVLVGIMVLVWRGSITQLVIATVLSQIFLLLQMQSGPFLDSADDYLANASSFSLVIVYLCCIIFKIGSLTEISTLNRWMAPEQREAFDVPADILLVVLFGSVIATLVLSFSLLLRQLAIEQARIAREEKMAKARRLLDKETQREVEVPPCEAGHYHTFLSHVWGTGQDQMRIVKQRLLEMMPDMFSHVFLDVDDLKEIGDLEGYIDRTSTVLIYCSKGYFESKNCMRELVSTTIKQKPVIALIELEASRGGLSFEQIRSQLIEAEGSYAKWGFDAETTPDGRALYDHLFASTAIEWNRISHFQDVTMRLIAERLLPNATNKTYVDNEIVSKKLKPLLPPKGDHECHIYCCPLNLGAQTLMQELATARGFTVKMTSSAEQKEEKVSVPLVATTDVKRLANCDHMLLYLTSQTWTRGEESEALAAEVTKAMDLGVHVLLAHEMPGTGGQEARFGVDFSSFFSCSDGATPSSLLHAGIYSQIAVPLKGGAWREASMALLGIELGLSKEEAVAKAREDDELLVSTMDSVAEGILTLGTTRRLPLTTMDSVGAMLTTSTMKRLPLPFSRTNTSVKVVVDKKGEEAPASPKASSTPESVTGEDDEEREVRALQADIRFYARRNAAHERHGPRFNLHDGGDDTLPR